MREACQHLPLAAGIGETHILHAYAQAPFKPHRLALLLQWQGGKLGKPLGGREHAYEGRYLPAHIDHGPLHLRHKLQEGRHHAEGHRALAQPEHAPQERHGISRHEPYLHHRAREHREIGAPVHLPLQRPLQFRQLADGLPSIFQRAHNDAMLQVFLQVALYAAVGIAYLTHHAPHLPHIALAEQQGHRHDEHEDARQPHVEPRQEEQRPTQLHDGDQHGGHRAANGIGYRRRVGLNAIEHIARMECLAPVPVAFHQVGEQSVVQVVAQPDFRSVCQPAANYRQDELRGQAACHPPYISAEAVGRNAGGYVDKMLAHIHEEERHAHIQRPGHGTARRRETEPRGSTPQPSCAFIYT